MKISLSGLGLQKNDSPFFKKEFLSQRLNDFKQTIEDSRFGFFNLTTHKTLLEESKKVHQKFKDRTHFYQIGIGGSSLGPEMLVTGLGHKKCKIQFINNIDPEMMADQLADLQPEKSLFYFVSKSGGTAETNAALAIITDKLFALGIKQDQLKNYFVFCTDPSKSDLLNLGRELGVDCLTVPSNIGGRFSVLTSVGLLPALFAGIDIDQLWNGAESIKNQILNSDVDSNSMLQLASSLMELKEKNGVNQTVFMPYSSKLRDFSFWFIQLWAESLGKKHSKSGEVINTGLTPIPGYGATDQHSQVQLFMEGPYDKCFFMIEVEKFSNDFSLKNDYKNSSLQKLSSYSLGQLMQAEFNGTLKALESHKRPYVHISLEKNNAFELGSAILFFESLTALIGHYLNIDPFDQPGVEAGKIFAFDYLNKL